MLRTLASPAVTRGILSSARTSTRTFASSSTTFSSDKPSSPPTIPTPITPTTPSSPPSGFSASTSSKPLVRESSSSPEDLNSRPLPYLSFPLGLPTPSSSSTPTWSETRDRLISPEHRMASRKAIVKEATRGYFHDFHAIKSHGDQPSIESTKILPHLPIHFLPTTTNPPRTTPNIPFVKPKH
ncbi:hypothetical protein NDA13_001572 [Ustilago tritici]|nr:hypothetical protein NDA13_001572 [Ustilago tritici]